jgi:hypothetical protein
MESENIICKIISFTGQTFEITIDSSSTVEELKSQIKSKINNIDFIIIYNGRVIKDENSKISELVSNNTPTFYLNASKVHGGCCCVDTLYK